MSKEIDINDIQIAIDRARTLQANVNRNVDAMARLIAGRLMASDVSTYTLAKLKKELKDFNMHTGRWKE